MDELQNLAEFLRHYDVADLLASAAALQLVPGNADRAIRLELLSHVVASLPYVEEQPKISKHKLARVCSTPPLGNSEISSREDPAEQAFSEAFTFTGGSYTVFPGITSDATFILKHLNKAIFLGSDPFPNRNFVRSARNANLVILALSNEIANRIGIAGNFAPELEIQQDVLMPHNLQQLKDAVVFLQSEIDQILHRSGVQAGVLEAFVTDMGFVKLGGFDWQEGPLHSKPLVRVGDKLIVSMPGCLLAALRHRLIVLAQEFDVIDELALRFHKAVWQTVTTCLEYFRYDRLGMPPSPNSALATVSEDFWAIDTDTALYAILVTDDLDNYEQDKAFGVWNQANVREITEQKHLAAEKAILEQTHGLNQIFAIYLYCGVGRTQFMGFEEPLPPLRAPRLIINAADFETIALLEAADPLVLLKFAKAADNLRNVLDILVWSTLDEFQMYRGAKYSYYFSDNTLPKFISFAPGGGGKLRLEVINRFDFHAVPSYRRGYIADVALLHETKKVPEYIILADAGLGIHLLVEGFAVPVWIIGSDNLEDFRTHGLHPHYTELADTIGHWLWQFTPDLAPLLDGLDEVLDSSLVIRLDLEPGPEWHVPAEPESLQVDEIVQFEIRSSEDEVVLHIKPTLFALMESSDNQGERQLMTVVLEAISQFLFEKGLADDSIAVRNEISSLIDNYAPLGLKKRLVILGSNADWRLDPRGLPQFRKVQDWDNGNLLDQLGRHLSETVGLTVGSIVDDQRTVILQEVVGFFYRRLEKAISMLNPDHLLEFVVAHHEAVIREGMEMRLTLPTRLACYENEPELIGELTKRIPDNDLAANASRFLIEYIAARPPHGLRPICLEVYDELLAVAANIIGWANDSDLIRYRSAEISLAMLSSGRLGVAQTTVTKAVNAFNPLRAQQVLHQADGQFLRNWQESSQSPPALPPGRKGEIDRAFAAEFGLTLNEASRLLSEIANLKLDDARPLKRMPFSQIAGELSGILSWPQEKVMMALELFSLKPREDFLKPPKPYSPEDVYPWRFGRPLSYLWKPLVQVTDEGTPTICWGTRHVVSSIEYIADMCLGGRLQARARSPEMRVLLGKIHTEQGTAFNAEVAAIFDGRANIIVRTQVRKIGSARIGTPGPELGDIDVLVVIPQKRKIIAIECKDLAIARTPREMANELAELFVGDGRKAPVVMRHLARCEWFKQHLTEALVTFGIELHGKWKVEPIMVVSDEMFTPHLYAPPFPVYSLLRFQTGYLPRLLD